MTAPRISILVVNYNTKAYILRCIDSVYASGIDSSLYEILVWDNHSSDGSVEAIRAAYPQVKLFAAQYNYGFAVGMNQLYTASAGDLVMTFNPDAEVDQNTLEQVIRYMDGHPAVGMMGMCVRDSEGRTEIPYHIMPAIDRPHLFKNLSKKNNTQQPAGTSDMEVSYIWGTGIVARRGLLGPCFFEERAFLFWEEYDLAKKIQAQQAGIRIVPSITFLHHASVSFKFNRERTRITRGLSLAWAYHYKKKEFGLLMAKLQVLVWIADNAALSCILGLKNIFSKNESRSLMLTQYSTVLGKSLQLLFAGTRTVKKTNARAAYLLNGGSSPVYPPVYTRIS